MLKKKKALKLSEIDFYLNKQYPQIEMLHTIQQTVQLNNKQQYYNSKIEK